MDWKTYKILVSNFLNCKYIFINCVIQKWILKKMYSNDLNIKFNIPVNCYSDSL